MWLKLTSRSKRVKSSSRQDLGGSSAARPHDGTDKPSPPSPPSSPPSSFHPPLSADVHPHNPPHHGHVLKGQRSQFLRLFGRRTVTPKYSSDSLSSVDTNFSAWTTSTTTRGVKSVASRSSISSSESSYAARTSIGRKEDNVEGRGASIRILRRDKGQRKEKEGAKPLFTPHLPPEIWIQILHLAAEPPHPFLSSSYLAPSPSPSPSYSPPSQDHESPSTPTAISEPVSFLTHPGNATSSHLSAAYTRTLTFKLALTTVCKLWHAIGQEVLWEFVWVMSGRHAEAILRLLDAKALRLAIGMGLGDAVERGGERTETFAYDTRNLGRYIRRLHIETSSSLDRCSPDTVSRILTHAKGLQVFSDFRGIRRKPAFRVFSPPSSTFLVTSNPEAGSSTTLSPPTTIPPYTYTSTSTISVTTSALLPSSPSTSSFDDEDIDSLSSSCISPSTSISSAPSTDLCLSTSSATDEDQVLSALLSPTSPTSLRRLSWTSYNHPLPSRPSSLLVLDHDAQGTDDDTNEAKARERQYEAGIRYFSMVVGPRIELAAARLEFLEVTLCGGDLGCGGGGGWLSSMLNGADGRVGNEMGVSSSTSVANTMVEPLQLPALRSLKVTLDNATFHVLSTWSIPSLVNLSVISADFSYAGDGFREFFEAHGAKLKQLELGHSTEAIEDHFLSASTSHAFGQPGLGPHANDASSANTNTNTNEEANGWRYGGMRVPLAEWCPALEQFICSAEAEWNWQNPDWIAPHVLLPAHPGLEFIGVRDLEKRIREGLDRCATLDRVQIGRAIDAERKGKGRVDVGGGMGGAEGVCGIEVRGRDGKEIRVDGDEAFFMLTEQFGSLFNRSAFPALKYVRDLSWESRVMRSSGGGIGKATGTGFVSSGVNPRHPIGAVRGFLRDILRPSQPLSFASPPISLSPPSTVPITTRESVLQQRLSLQQHRRVLRFWMRVLEKCKERGVYLEDCSGWSVTVGEMRRVALVGLEEMRD